ncbi:MAG: hypothetical protein ACJAT8_000411 [Cellvibrionaceae bacterium]|jgi:hypothetical protein
MNKQSAPNEAPTTEQFNQTILPRDLTIRAELLLRNPAPIGVSSNDWHDKYHAPSARNTPSDLSRKFQINVIKLPSRKTPSGKQYWPHALRDNKSARELAELIERSRICHDLDPIPDIENLLKAFE